MKVCIFGGGGFVGRTLAQKLRERGHHVRIVSRAPAKADDERQERWHADVYDHAQRRAAVRGQDVVINLIGILHGDAATFQRVHAELAEDIAQACRDESVTQFLHMSALHAALDAPSLYLRSKGQGAERVHALASEALRVTSFHPSVIFGVEDNFLNQFAALLRFSPGIMLLPGAQARFAPVYVGDVADAFVQALEGEPSASRISLCGPQDYSLLELVKLTAQWSGHWRLILPMPPFMAHLAATMLSVLPNPPLSSDNLDSMRVDSVCHACDARQPTRLETVAPHYLRR